LLSEVNESVCFCVIKQTTQLKVTQNTGDVITNIFSLHTQGINKPYFHNIVISVSVAREQVGKHVPAKKNSWPTIGKGLSIARQRAVNEFC
jgi:hypothetical protein